MIRHSEMTDSLRLYRPWTPGPIPNYPCEHPPSELRVAPLFLTTPAEAGSLLEDFEIG